MTPRGDWVTAPVTDLSMGVTGAPCCPDPGDGLLCQFRPGKIRWYLDLRRDAYIGGRFNRDFWVELIVDGLKDEAESVWVQRNPGAGSLHSRVRDVVCTLESAERDHGIPLTYGNARRVARLVCPFACEEV